VSAGGDAVCVRTAGGEIWCWGISTGGATGTGLSDILVGPEKNLLGVPAIDLVMGADHGCAIASDRTLWCWGRVPSRVSFDPLYAPEQVTGVADVTAMTSANDPYACVMSSADAIGCLRPEGLHAIDLGVPSHLIAAGSGHLCAAAHGGIYCEGTNANGQLGDGTRAERDVPVRAGVSCP
jgi:alpha-tubulin suppressor-like RCC1 family protein